MLHRTETGPAADSPNSYHGPHRRKTQSNEVEPYASWYVVDACLAKKAAPFCCPGAGRATQIRFFWASPQVELGADNTDGNFD